MTQLISTLLAIYLLFFTMPSLAVPVTILSNQYQHKKIIPTHKKNTQPQQTKKNREPYQEVQALRNAGKIQQAKKKAQQALQKNPNDTDVLVILGSINDDEQNYVEAKRLLNKVLIITPRYPDAYVLLARTELATKNYKAALDITKKGLHYFPQNKELKQYKKLAEEEKSELPAKQNHINTPNAPEQPPTKPWKTLRECCAEWIAHQAEIYYAKRQYYQAANRSQKALTLDPNNSKATEILANVNDINPKYSTGINEIGFYSENDRASDVNQVWDYSTVYLSQQTKHGQLITSINHASRLGHQGPQVEVEFLPVFDKHFVLDLDAQYANEPVLFPSYSLAAEGFFYFETFVDFSLGARYSKLTDPILRIYTGSIAKETANYWFSFRPYYFVPGGTNGSSTLYTATIRRFFGTDDFNISITVGYGRSPDLNNFQVADFITLDNRFVSINGEIPFFNHKMAILLGADYQRQIYPTFLRNLSGGTVGLLFHF